MAGRARPLLAARIFRFNRNSDAIVIEITEGIVFQLVEDVLRDIERVALADTFDVENQLGRRGPQSICDDQLNVGIGALMEALRNCHAFGGNGPVGRENSPVQRFGNIRFSNTDKSVARPNAGLGGPYRITRRIECVEIFLLASRNLRGSCACAVILWRGCAPCQYQR